MKTRFALLGASATVASLLFAAPSAFAAVQTAIQIEQVSPANVGSWTVLFADGSSKKSTETGMVLGNTSFTITDFAPITLSVVPPAGMAARITVYRNGDASTAETVNQYSFTPLPNETYRFLIQYSYARLGTLGVTSDPPTLRFRMKGPSGTRMLTAKTPFTFKELPAGKYTLYFAASGKCVQPAPYGVTVEPEKRNTAHITLSCDSEETETVDTTRVSRRTLREQAQKREFKPRGQRK